MKIILNVSSPQFEAIHINPLIIIIKKNKRVLFLFNVGLNISLTLYLSY